MYVRSLVTEYDVRAGRIYEVLVDEETGVTVRDDAGESYYLSGVSNQYEIINNQPAALTSTTHVLKIEHKFKVTKTIDNTVQLELQHGVYSKDNVQELIDILVKLKEEM